MAAVAWAMMEILRAFSWQSHAAPGEFVMTTKAEMQTMWERDGGKEAQMPKVDFDKETVIAVFGGEKNGSGYRIHIDLVVHDKDDTQGIVVYRETEPGADSRAAQKSYPNHVVVVPKTAAKFKFVTAESPEGKDLIEKSKKAAAPAAK
jgi:hypothetical protein